MNTPVLAAARWPTNADLIADVARLGYLRSTDRILDATYGRGRFWTRWTPVDGELVAHDLKLDGVDFRSLPHDDGEFDATVLDGPYKLNGTPVLGDFDQAYGVDVTSTWQDRHQLIRDGIAECARVTRPGGHVLVKCQDQVCSGAVRWQTDEFTDFARTLDLVKVDRFDLLGGSRPQPMAGRRQQHAHGRPSTLLIFRAPAAAPQLALNLQEAARG